MRSLVLLLLPVAVVILGGVLVVQAYSEGFDFGVVLGVLVVLLGAGMAFDTRRS